MHDHGTIKFIRQNRFILSAEIISGLGGSSFPLKNLDGLLIADTWEWRRHTLQLGEIPFQQLQFGATRLQHTRHDVREKLFREIHHVRQFSERHFRLNHPKLHQVPTGLGLLRAKGRAKAIDFSEGRGSGFAVQVAFDPKAKTITITDNGIGMNKEEAIRHLGTIAKSGTQEFMKSLTGDQAKDRHLIGQFGVGFYSSFIVADRVTVKSRIAGEPSDQGVCWESTGEGDYTIENIDKATRGTEITLHLKAGEEEFLNAMRLEHIIKKYSDHIALPIVMDREIFPEQSEENTEVKSDEKAYEEYAVNRATALWTLPKSQIDDEHYIEF